MRAPRPTNAILIGETTIRRPHRPHVHPTALQRRPARHDLRLIALGFNLVVGALDKLNFALGETAMVTAIMASLLMVNDSLPFPVTFVLCLLGGAVLRR